MKTTSQYLSLGLFFSISLALSGCTGNVQKETCTNNSECASGLECRASQCVAPLKEQPKPDPLPAKRVLINPAETLSVSEDGTSATFTVKLAVAPKQGVSFALKSSDTDEAVMDVELLKFTPQNWDKAQTVTVTGVDDSLLDGPQKVAIEWAPAVSEDTTFDQFKPDDVPVQVLDNDTAGFVVEPTTPLTTSEDGTSATFTLRLTNKPIAPVTLQVGSKDVTEGIVSPDVVTFTPSDWNQPQTLTVTGKDDDAVDGVVAYEVVFSESQSTDKNYDKLPGPVVKAQNSDNDTAAIVVKASPQLSVKESGTTATFTLALATRPSANVVISLSSSDTTEGSVAPASVTFTETNWNATQTVTVSGVNDFEIDGVQNFTIFTAAAESTDVYYSGLNAQDVTVSNEDDDVAGIEVTPTSGLTVSEDGTTASFSVRLLAVPKADVTVGLASSDPAEGSINFNSLVFNASNWQTAQHVTVTGQDDSAADGPKTFSILLSAAVSTDSNYQGVKPLDVQFTCVDNDIAGFVVSPTSGLFTTEAGAQATFSIRLATKPTANVEVALSSSVPQEGTVSPAKVSFTPNDWNTLKTVTVTGVNDARVDGPKTFDIVTAPAVSSDAAYNGKNPPDVSVINSDDDVAGIEVSPVSGLTTSEAGGTASFTVRLSSQPVANVNITLSSSDVTEGTVSPSLLTFSSTNWATPKTVTVKGADDLIDDGTQTYTIVLQAAVSADADYQNLKASDVSVSNSDDDVAGFTVTPQSGLVTTEAGGTATFTVKLKTQPTSSVTLNFTSSNLQEGTVSPASVTFNDSNWNVAQTVTARGVNDNIDDGSVSYSIVTAAAVSSDAAYNGLNPTNVSVSNTDDDTAGFAVTPTAGLVTSEAGTTATFTVRLNSEPRSNVVLGVFSSNTLEGTVSPAFLTFTSSTWNVGQNVVLTGQDDSIVDGNVTYQVDFTPASSTDSGYQGLKPSAFNVSNADNDASMPSKAVWTNVTPSNSANSPTPRYFHSMVYDAVRDTMLMFGGSAEQLSYSNQTWEWDFSQKKWTLLNPINSPWARDGHTMVYDSARGKVVLFGGYSANGYLDDTWEWDGAQGNWTIVNSTPPPPARAYHAMAYDAARGKVVVVGGYNNGGVRTDTWEWDGAQGNWTNVTPSSSPPGLLYSQIAYDASRGKVLLFGGNESFSGVDQTWEWDGTQKTWTQLSPTTSPMRRYGHSMAYDSTLKKIVVFGGTPDNDRLGDTWAWDGNLRQWTQLTTTTFPSERFLGSMAYDPIGKKFLLFGGYSNSRLNDTWELEVQ